MARTEELLDLRELLNQRLNRGIRMQPSHIRANPASPALRRYQMQPTSRHHKAFYDPAHVVLKETLTAVPVPDKSDWRNWYPGVRDQKNEGACTGFGTANVREILFGTSTGKMIEVRLAPAFLYGLTREEEGTWPRDSGACMADEFSVLNERGVCPENFMPYDADPAEPIPNDAYAAALPYRVEMPLAVDMTDPDKVCAVLGAGMPIGIAIPVYQSFEDVGSNGQLPIPDATKEALKGGHGLCLCGHDKAHELYIGINQWGEGWGDKGFFYMPFNYPFWEGWTAAKTPAQA